MEARESKAAAEAPSGAHESAGAADRSTASPETPASAERALCGLAAGDVLALALPPRLALLRVVRVHTHRLGETPVLEELDFDGSDVPMLDALERLGPRVKGPITFTHPLSSDTRLFAFVMKGIDWQGAGFRKVQTIAPRAGDERAAVPGTGISWAELAARYHRRAAQ